MANPDLSFVIPIKDEEESLPQLTQEIAEQCIQLKKSYQIVFIDDGSVDQSFKVIQELHQKDKNIEGVQLRGNFGKSVALSVGFAHANGSIIFTMDGDLQDKPSEIPRFLEKLDQGYDLVSGWKQRRYDPLSKTLPSKLFNYLASRFTKVKIHDFNCGFKAYRRAVVTNLNIYGELYRFIPALAFQKRFKVAEIIVEHQARKYGRSKYGWSRLIRGLLDLITVTFLSSYGSRPGHFFGSLGILLIIPGFFIGLYITYLRITTGGIEYRYPLLFLGILLILAGTQLVSTGLIAEMIVNNRPRLNPEEIILQKI